MKGILDKLFFTIEVFCCWPREVVVAYLYCERKEREADGKLL
jgi:hypothetical protein